MERDVATQTGYSKASSKDFDAHNHLEKSAGLETDKASSRGQQHCAGFDLGAAFAELSSACIVDVSGLA